MTEESLQNYCQRRVLTDRNATSQPYGSISEKPYPVGRADPSAPVQKVPIVYMLGNLRCLLLYRRLEKS